MPKLRIISMEIGHYKVDFEIKEFAPGEFVPQHMREAQENPVDTSLKTGVSQYITGITRIYINTAVGGRSPKWEDLAGIDVLEALVNKPKLEQHVEDLKEQLDKATIQIRNMKTANTKLKRRLGEE